MDEKAPLKRFQLIAHKVEDARLKDLSTPLSPYLSVLDFLKSLFNKTYF